MKILLADDDPITVMRLGKLLEQWGYDVVVARDGLESRRVLDAEDAPQLAIVDWRMPGLSGIDLCRSLRSERRERYVYVLLLTVNKRKEDIVAGLDAGADDYLVKPFNPQELHVRLQGGRRIIALEESLRFQATHDALTGVWNRRGILDLLGRELARESQKSVGVISVDIDHFKTVNDTHGHHVGDAVLVAVATRLQRSMRSYDGVGRIGGEEFLIVAPGQGLAGARVIAERMRSRIANGPIQVGGLRLSITASFGIVAGVPGAPAAAVMHSADEALYRAKSAGRDRVEAAALQCTAATALQYAGSNDEARKRRKSHARP